MRVLIAVLLNACLAFSAVAAEEGALRPEWSAEGKLLARSVAKSTLDPDGPSARVERAPLMQLRPGASCGSTEFEVCVDSTGRITVPGAKRFLPDLPGLKPERLTVRRSGLILGYSF